MATSFESTHLQNTRFTLVHPRQHFSLLPSPIHVWVRAAVIKRRIFRWIMGRRRGNLCTVTIVYKRRKKYSTFYWKKNCPPSSLSQTKQSCKHVFYPPSFDPSVVETHRDTHTHNQPSNHIIRRRYIEKSIKFFKSKERVPKWAQQDTRVALRRFPALQSTGKIHYAPCFPCFVKPPIGKKFVQFPPFHGPITSTEKYEENKC